MEKPGDIITREEVEGTVAGYLTVDFNADASFKVLEVSVVGGPEEVPIRENPAFATIKYQDRNGIQETTRTLADVTEMVKNTSDATGVEFKPIINQRPSNIGGKSRKTEFFSGFRIVEPS